MKLEIEVSEEVLKKIKALSALSDDVMNLESTISHMLDQGVTAAIMQKLGGSGSFPEATQMLPSIQTPLSTKPGLIIPPEVSDPVGAAMGHYRRDASTVSDGLGDVDDESITDEAAFVPKTGGLTDSVLNGDLEVEDPAHEGVAEGRVQTDEVSEGSFANDMEQAKIKDQANANMFAQMADFPAPDYEARRKRNSAKAHARVTPMTE